MSNLINLSYNKDKTRIKLIFQIEKEIHINETTTISNIQNSIQEYFTKGTHFNFKVKDYEISPMLNVPVMKTINYYNSNSIICIPSSTSTNLHISNISSNLKK